ncbi:MAG: DUF4367 domain-containing protein [Spirochaetota bacterium]
MIKHRDDEDRFLKECAERQMAGYERREPEELWKEFESRYLRRRRRSGGLRLVIAAAAVALFALGVGVLVFPEQVRAVGKRLVSITLEFTGDTQAQIGVSVDEGGQVPAPPTTEPGLALLEEIKTRVPYAIKMPAFIPEGYGLRSYRYEPPPHWVLTLHYQNDGRFLKFRQMHFEGAQGFGSATVVDVEDSNVTEVRIGNALGTLVERRKGDWVLVKWVEGSVLYEISGHLGPEEALKSAESVAFLE